MKPLRILLLGAAVVGGIAAALAAVALNSRFQTWAARRALASRPVAIGTVAVGLDRLEVTDLHVARGGAVLDLPELQAELPVLSAALGHRVLVRRLTAAGWTLDLSRARLGRLAAGLSKGRDGPPARPQLADDWDGANGRPGRPSPPFSLLSSAYADEATASAAAAEVFGGLFHRLQLPVDLQLDGLAVEGDVVLPPAPGSAAPVRVHVVLSGGGLAAGREGRFVFAIKAASTGSVVTADGTLAAEMDTPRTFVRLATRIDAAAVSGKFSPGTKLAVELKAERAAGSEDYQLGVAAGNRDLATIRANYTGATHGVAGTWKVDASDDDLSPFVLGRPLPAFAAAGGGRFETDATLGNLSVSGRLGATVDRLGLLRPALAAIGALKLTAEFDLGVRNGELRVERLTATLAGAQPIAEVAALQAFAFNGRTGALEVADPARDLVGIRAPGAGRPHGHPGGPAVAERRGRFPRGLGGLHAAWLAG
jgi:hypothetical protein